jgi:hypothetical protein
MLLLLGLYQRDFSVLSINPYVYVVAAIQNFDIGIAGVVDFI